MKTIRVRLGPVRPDRLTGLGSRSYAVVIGRGLLRSAGARLKNLLRVQEVYVCSSAPIRNRYGPTLRASCRRAGLGLRWLLVPDGERAKTLVCAGRLFRQLARAGAGRDAAVVAFGGGSVGDTAGFVASTYMRGIRYVQIPTTLEAQVDAAIGGKTAVDLPEGKNLIGAFHQPAAVFSDPEVLRTLARRQLCAGLAEVVKYGVIASRSLFAWLERNAFSLLRAETAALCHVVEASSRIKAEVVMSDERESGRRIILNYGHTLGHALEAAGGYRRLLHGEAVAIGMVAAARCSVALGIGAPEVPRRLEVLLKKLRLPVSVPAGFSRVRILAAMGLDKKKRRGRHRVVLTRAIGSVTVRDDIEPRVLLAMALRPGAA